MAQTSGTRDEPSMEDILSSIRKIIQSNEEKEDDGPKEQGADQKVVQSPALEAATPETSAPETPTSEETPVVEAPQPEVVAEKPQPKLVIKPVEQPAAKEQPAPKPQIMASKPVDVAPASNVNEEVQSERGELTAAPARAPQAVAQPAVVSPPVEEAPAPAPKVEPESVPSLAAQIVASAQESGVEKVVAALEVELNSPKVTEVEAPSETQSSVPALLSSGSGAKVAASFAELTQTLEEHSDKNLEDMASSMLRPMLQDWLDDNLPSLVERLVREEIERVARGG